MASLIFMGIGLASRLIRRGMRMQEAERRERRNEQHYHAAKGKNARFPVRSVRISSVFKDGKVVYYHLVVDDREEGWELQRRFADFVHARDGLLIKNDPNEFKLNPLCPFPPKDMNNRNLHISDLSSERMEQRRVALENWLNERIQMVQRKYDDPEWMERNNLRHAIYRMEAELAWLLGVDSTAEKHTPVRKPSITNEDGPAAVVMAEETPPVVAAVPVLTATQESPQQQGKVATAPPHRTAT